MACLNVAGHRFLGATVTNINTNLGWGSNGTSMTVSLVEDECGGDNFNPPIIGSPVCVNVGDGGWNFGGFLDSWELKSSVSSGHTYDVQIVDPTDLLSGYQCVLANYDGSVFGLPNLANVFGYLENFLGTPCVDFLNGDSYGVNYTPANGWGGSHINSGGIPSTLVISALNAILNGAGGVFGTFPYYRQNSYRVDLSRLTYLPVYNYNYRIGGDNASVLDIIDRMCKDSGFDYYLGLDCAGTTVTVYPVRLNRAFGGFSGAYAMDVSAGDIDAGDIASSIAIGTYYSNKSIGLSHTKETVNAFTVGDNFQGIHQVTQVQTCTPNAATIWPYWGDDWTGNPILGYGCNDEHTFMADSREWDVLGVGAFYQLSVSEIRAAMVSKSAWLAWMAIHKEQLAEDLCLGAHMSFANLLKNALKKPNKPKEGDDPVGKANLCKANANKPEEFDMKKNVDNLYNAIKSITNEFYGKKYMVTVPFICKYYEDETGELKTNWEKTESGWSEIGVLGLNAGSVGLQVFKTPEGKIEAFVRFDNALQLDLTKLQKGDFFYQGSYIWLKCTVQKLVQTGGKFWAVIDLKMPVFWAQGKDAKAVSQGFYLRLIKDAHALGKIGDDDKEEFEKLVDVEAKQLSNQMLRLKDGPIAQIPHAAAIPLKSAKVSYGPWYAGYLGGKTDYNRDTQFSPWSFGSAAVMQLAGAIHTSHKAIDVEIAEKGTVTIPGYPTAFLGDRSAAITGTAGGGPIISGIQVSHSVQGVNTTYQFRTFAPKFGQLSKSIVDGMQRRGQAIMKNNHRILQRLLEPPPPNSAIYAIRQALLTTMNQPDEDNRDAAKTQHDMIMGMQTYYQKEDYPGASWHGDNLFKNRQDLAIGNYTNDFSWTLAYTDVDTYSTIAGVEPIGIFRPFRTDGSNGIMSGYSNTGDQYYNDHDSSTYDAGSEEGFEDSHKAVDFDPDSGVANTNKFYTRAPLPPAEGEYNMPITIKTMNPFKNKDGFDLYGFADMNGSQAEIHDIDFVVRGSVFPQDVGLSVNQQMYSGALPDENYRSVSLRGPVIITGWGFDTNGRPVPSQGDDPLRFKDDWLQKPSDWKTGALDVRWDEDRGLWVPPTSFKLVNAKCCECVGPATDSKGWFQISGDDETEAGNKKTHDNKALTGVEDNCNCDTEDTEQVMAINRTGKVVLPDAQVLLYFDTRNHKYYIITAPDPIVIAKMDKLMMPEVATDEDYATATVEKGIHDLGTFSDSCGKIVRVVNTLKQPICKDSKAFIYLTKCNSSASDGGGDGYNFEGEVLQAEFEPLTVVTSVDCYEHPDTGEATLEICDRRIYVQTAYTIEDCGDDDPSVRNDTKGWRPEEDFDDKKNKDPEAGDFCPSDWNKDETG